MSAKPMRYFKLYPLIPAVIPEVGTCLLSGREGAQDGSSGASEGAGPAQRWAPHSQACLTCLPAASCSQPGQKADSAFSESVVMRETCFRGIDRE